MAGAGKTIKQRLKSLEQHLRKENPVLVSAVESYRHLDHAGHVLGMLDTEQSFATQISWWPMISVLGTFSAGKSTFINHYLGARLQQTGNQAVDDKFTVICFGGEHPSQSLPGVALDADPRFPFYQISNELEKVATGEGRRVDSYLQLKTCPSERLRGRIIIDSPGFDADSQRTATLRLTDHIVDLSDLVLIFFDARHPEPGAMRDTLAHLVGDTIHRPDATKFVYILNQMDTTAREDNPEEVIGAWQRAIAQEGLTAGRFYSIYNPDVAVTIADESVRTRYESKRDHDLAEIHERIQRVGVGRAYRIIGSLEKIAHHIEEKVIPWLRDYKARWRRLVLWGDVILFVVFLAVVSTLAAPLGFRDGWHWSLPGWLHESKAVPVWGGLALTATIMLLVYLHFKIRKLAAHRIARAIKTDFAPGLECERLYRAFHFNTRGWHSIFSTTPVGWGKLTRKRLHRVIAEANDYIQKLNDTFTDPSGKQIPMVRSAAKQPVDTPEEESPSTPPTPGSAL